MAAGIVECARRNVMRIILYVLHALIFDCNAMDMGQGQSGWIKGC